MERMRSVSMIIAIGCLFVGCSSDKGTGPDTPVKTPTWIRVGDTSATVNAIASSSVGRWHLAGCSRGLLVSTDDGKTWTWKNGGLATLDVRAVAAWFPTGRWYAGTWGGGVFVTTDGGVSWTAANTGLSHQLITALAFDSASMTLYAATWGGGVFRTTNQGISWQGGVGTLPSEYVRALHVVAGGILVAGTYVGLASSTDGGVTWSTTMQFVECREARCLRWSDDRSTLVVGTAGCGVYRSLDLGATWSVIVGLSARDVVMSPDAQRVYVASGVGIHESKDGGATWRPLTSGLKTLDMTSLSYDQGRKLLLAGSQGGGLYRMELAD